MRFTVSSCVHGIGCGFLDGEAAEAAAAEKGLADGGEAIDGFLPWNNSNSFYLIAKVGMGVGWHLEAAGFVVVVKGVGAVE